MASKRTPPLDGDTRAGWRADVADLCLAVPRNISKQNTKVLCFAAQPQRLNDLCRAKSLPP